MRAIFDAAAGVPWAITPEGLRTILALAAGEGEGPQALAARLGRPLDNARAVTTREGVAIIPIVGPIFHRANLFTEISGATSTEILALDITTALEDQAVHSLLFDIDSPGGQATGIHELAELVFRARKRKPMCAYVTGMAASAAYWLASATDEVVVDATALVGSIGVVMAAPKPDDERARTVEIVSSQSPKKRLDVTTTGGRAEIQRVVDDLADVFVGAVARNRGVTPETVLRDFGAGGILVGQAAVDAGLADRLGSFEETLAGLVERQARERAQASPWRLERRIDVDAGVAAQLASFQPLLTELVEQESARQRAAGQDAPVVTTFIIRNRRIGA